MKQAQKKCRRRSNQIQEGDGREARRGLGGGRHGDRGRERPRRAGGRSRSTPRSSRAATSRCSRTWVLAAVNEARRRSEDMLREAMSRVAGPFSGLPLRLARDRSRGPRAPGSPPTVTSLLQVPLERLVDELDPAALHRAQKTAQRIAFHLLRASREEALTLARGHRPAREGEGGPLHGVRQLDSESRAPAPSAPTPSATPNDGSASSRSRPTSWRSRGRGASAAATTCCTVRSRRSRGSAPTSCASRDCWIGSARGASRRPSWPRTRRSKAKPRRSTSRDC